MHDLGETNSPTRTSANYEYGKTTGELTSGQRAYAERQRQLGRDYQLARQRGFTGSWIDWLRTRGDRTTQVPPLEVVTPFSPQRERPVPFETQQEQPQPGPSRQVDDSSHLEGMEHIFDESMNIDDGTRETRGVTGGGGVSNPIGSTESALRQTNNRAPESADRTKYPTNECGWYKLDNYYNRWNFMPKIGETIIDYSYKPVNGIIQWKRHFVPYDTNDSDTAFNMASNGTTLPVKTTIKNFYNTNTKRLEVNLANGTISSAYTTAQMYHEPNQLDLLKMSVDPTKVLSSNIKEVRNKNIPLIYIGILPVPQLNPSVATTNFQNSCACSLIKNRTHTSVGGIAVNKKWLRKIGAS
ncbi:hypothetical protein QE152_g10688 [Popillia japonica]|uniref:Uncharacterized protein n=1 Tax=Popillia japonica TaxID=7064 RepID=A0AAW1LUS8_POPJA